MQTPCPKKKKIQVKKIMPTPNHPLPLPQESNVPTLNFAIIKIKDLSRNSRTIQDENLNLSIFKDF